MCCRRDKRTCHLVVVWWMLLSYVLSILPGSSPAFFWSEWSPVEFVTRSVICTIGICLGILDIYGINKNNTFYMIPFLVWLFLSTIITGIAAVVSAVVLIIMVSNGTESDDDYMIYYTLGAMIAVFLVASILSGYFSNVVSLHRREVYAKEQQAEQAADVGTKKCEPNTEIC